MMMLKRTAIVHYSTNKRFALLKLKTQEKVHGLNIGIKPINNLSPPFYFLEIEQYFKMMLLLRLLLVLQVKVAIPSAQAVAMMRP